MLHFVQQYSGLTVGDDGKQYVARAYAAPRPDNRWDAWFVFLPLDGGRSLVTGCETTQRTLADVKYWSDAIGAVYLQGALERAWTSRPETRISRRAQQAAEEEALARAAVATYTQAAADARAAAATAKHDRRAAEAQLLAERAAAARAAVILQKRAAAAAREQVAAPETRRRQFNRRTGFGPATRQHAPSVDRARASHSPRRRRG